MHPADNATAPLQPAPPTTPIRWLTALLCSLAAIHTIGCAQNRVAPPMHHQSPPPTLNLERISTAVPFPRGLALVDGELYALARGRVRGAGGVTRAVNDRAGTLFRINTNIAEPLTPGVAPGDPPPPIRTNATVVAEPSAPPFYLWNRDATPPESDRLTDRPYCTLRFDPASKNLFICAFSGIDMPRRPHRRSFSKNLTDAILRYDLRTHTWHEVERHDHMAGGTYPHHDTRYFPPPHGFLNGPDNLAIVGHWLYAVAKDNNTLARYDLQPIRKAPNAPAPPATVALRRTIQIRNPDSANRTRTLQLFGHSMLAVRDQWLYLGYRTSSVIIRLPLANDGTLAQPVVGELLARFDPYDPQTGKSANITDMRFDSHGRLYVVSAKPSRIYRFTPDPKRVFDARNGHATPWADLAALTANPHMKSENLLIDAHDRVYVTSGDGYTYQAGAAGTIYRITEAHHNLPPSGRD